MVKMAPEMFNRDGDTGASTPEAWKSTSLPTTKPRPSTEPPQLDLWEDSFSCFYFSSHKSHSSQLHSNTDKWNFKCKSKLETETKNITPWIITDLLSIHNTTRLSAFNFTCSSSLATSYSCSLCHTVGNREVNSAIQTATWGQQKSNHRIFWSRWPETSMLPICQPRQRFKASSSHLLKHISNQNFLS